MPSRKGNDPDFDWNKTFSNLQATLQNRGPLRLQKLGAVYKRFTGTDLKFNGLKLRACVEKGLLRGIILDGETIALDGKDRDSNMAARKCEPSSTPLQTSGGTDRDLTQDINNKARSLVSADAPVFYVVSDEASWLSAIGAVSTVCMEVNAKETTSLRDISAGKVVAICVDGKNLGTEDGAISVIEVATVRRNSNALIILSFNVVTLERTETGRKILRGALCALLEDIETIKVVCDFADHAIALKRHFGEDLQIQSTLDAQIAYEALHGGVGEDIASVSEAFAAKKPNGLTASSWRLVSNSRARSTILLWEAVEGLRKALMEGGEWDNVMKASRLRINFAMKKMLHSTRRLTFRSKPKTIGGGTGRVLVSYELKKAQQESAAAKDNTRSSPSKKQALSSQDTIENSLTLGMIQRLANNGKTAQVGAEDDPNSPKELLELMPQEFFLEHLSNRHTANLQDLVEVVLDEGMRPYAQFRGHGRVPLVTDQGVVVTRNHIDKVVGNLERDGQFGKDNRAGFPGKLHRVSVMRDKVGSIYGVTLRVGRFFNGSAGIIDDLLFHVADSPESPERPASVLILGEAGSGKTTVIRDICRKISASETLVIVDTSNEIAGDGRLPHREAIGLSRRIMVADRSNQHRVMIEALQNHTPRTIVVDEISNNLEARACRDIKARGVRLVASAHGDLESLMKNPCLNTLVGGTTSVTLGDAMARDRGGNKVITQRAEMPVFDTVIQLQPGDVNTWSVVRNVAPAVDRLLSGDTYDVEQRTRLVDDEHQQGLESEDVIFLQQHRRQARQYQRFY